MPGVDEFLLIHGDSDVVLHMRDYDPVAAREYYLRTRELKGRKKGVTPLPVNRMARHAPGKALAKKPVAVLKPTAHPKPKKLTAKQAKELTARVEHLKGRLEALRKVLAALVKQAKLRSGVDPAKIGKDGKPVSKTASTKSDSKLTAKQKADHAKSVKKYDDKHKDDPKTPDQQAKELEAKIAEVTEKIKKMRAELADARQKATANTRSKSL